jgi:hypothetical protein
MKYVFTKGQKRMQQNLLLQMWRFAALSIKFMKLTRIDYSRPHSAKSSSDSKSSPTPVGQTRESRG